MELPAVDRARVDLLVRIDEARSAGLIVDGGAWIYVTFDRDDGHPVNAAGFWTSEADAMLAAATDPDEGVHHPLPLFVLNPR